MKRSHIVITALLIPLSLFLVGCTSDASDMAKILQVMERDDPDVFEKVIRSWVECALNGDIDGMIARTSKVTIAQ